MDLPSIKLCISLLIYLVIVNANNTNNMSSADVLILEKLLKNYDSRVGPFEYTGKPTVIKMSIYIIEMSNFSDLDMEFTMVIFFRRSWRDPRLSFSHLTSDNSTVYMRELKDIWWPDVFFVNERASKLHVTTLPNTSTRINADGTVLVSSKYSVTFSCPVDMRNFPLDTQTCKMELESYTYPVSLVKFEWMKDGLELPDHLHLTQFSLESKELQQCTNLYSTGGFACLTVQLKFARKYTYHILNTYLPSSFIVVVSWISFWISPDAVPGRVTLGVTTVLTMTTQTFLSGLSLPHVPYIKAVDLWLAVSMIFVFGALIEYAIVNVKQRKNIKVSTETSKGNADEFSDSQKEEDTSKDNQISTIDTPSLLCQTCKHGQWNKIDKISQYLFPILYVFFATVYWVFYLNWTPEHKENIIGGH